MKTGISLYPGLDSPAALCCKQISKAHALGIQRIFTSLHIPETNIPKLQQELHTILHTARQCSMDVIADISPQTEALLNIRPDDPLHFIELGITTVRLDAGFSPEKTALLSRIMPVQINASTVRECDLRLLGECGADFSHIDSLHNFYPHPYTGLHADFVETQTNLLHRFGIAVGAFVPSQSGKRAPLYEGLPTIEDHRTYDVSLAARHLSALGIDSVFIGDDSPSDEELRALSQIQQSERGVITLKAQLYSRDWHIQDIVSQTFTARPDPAAYVLRTQESRKLLHGCTILPDNSDRERRYGDITLDNIHFLRYMGELQIVLQDIPKDTRTNIVARVSDSDLFLLSYIKPGQKFRFEWVRS